MTTMGVKLFYFLFVFLLSTSLVYAVSDIPGIPHQFYGSVTVNGVSVPDNTIIIATIDGDSYATITTGGEYGLPPTNFFVEDPEWDRAGDTISFDIGGMDVGSATFENNGYTEMNLALTTTCDDGYCLGEESCSTCAQDCGVCTGSPVITIVSPTEGTVYDSTKIGLDVSANQEILVWMYSLFNSTDTEGPITFIPNSSITIEEEGSYTLTVIGVNNVYQSGSAEVSFTVKLPECGNDIVSGEEECDRNNFAGKTCSTYDFNAGSLSCTPECKVDYGACYNEGGNVNTGGGGGGGGGGGSSKNDDEECTYDWHCTKWTACSDGKQTRTCTNEGTCEGTEEKPETTNDCIVSTRSTGGEDRLEGESESESESESGAEGTPEEQPQRRGLAAITGAILGPDGLKSPRGMGLIAFLVGLVVLGAWFYFKKRKK